MKPIFTIAILLLFAGYGQAQILKKVKKAAERGVERTVEKKVEKKASEKTDQALDAVLEPGKQTHSTKSPKTSSTQNQPKAKPGSGDAAQNPEIKGEVIFTDNFLQTPLGDFPVAFTSSSGGAVVEVNATRGLMFNPNSNILIQTSALPVNFALAFELTLQNVPASLYNTFFNVYVQQNKTLKHNDPQNKYGAIGFSLWGDKKDHQIDLFNHKTTYEIKEKIPFNVTDALIDNTAAFLILVNGNRLQLYINGIKIADSPSLLEGMKAGYINFRLNGTKKEENHRFIISQVKIIKTEQDLRSQMMEGRFSTNEILFAPNSAQIDQGSYPILNEIGKVMQENPETMFLIAGHTDSDGSAEANQLLSDKRAAAVKQYLLAHFKINSHHLRTIGKGETDPVAPNSTAEGKAQNRRVEFIKEN